MSETTNKGGRPQQFGGTTKPVRVPLPLVPVVEALREGRPPPGYVSLEAVEKADALFTAGLHKMRQGQGWPREWEQARVIVHELAITGEQSADSAAMLGAQHPGLLEIARACAKGTESTQSIKPRAQRLLAELGEPR